MGLIWLYLLGLSNFASGSYTLAEQVLTGIIGVASMVGVVAILSNRPRTGPAKAATAIIGFGIFQFFVMWLSFTSPFANK